MSDTLRAQVHVALRSVPAVEVLTRDAAGVPMLDYDRLTDAVMAIVYQLSVERENAEYGAYLARKALADERESRIRWAEEAAELQARLDRIADADMRDFVALRGRHAPPAPAVSAPPDREALVEMIQGELDGRSTTIVSEVDDSIEFDTGYAATALADRLLAAIDEDEKVAREAHDCGDNGVSPAASQRWLANSGNDIYSEGHGVLLITGPYGGLDEPVLKHIIRHDPARVLLGCEADRDLIEAYRTAVEFCTPGSDGAMRGAASGLREALVITARRYGLTEG